MHTIAARGSRRVISALVATVVPWENSATSLRSTPALASPAMMPSIGSGDDSRLLDADQAGRLVHDADVGKGATDIDGNAQLLQGLSSRSSARRSLASGSIGGGG